MVSPVPGTSRTGSWALDRRGWCRLSLQTLRKITFFPLQILAIMGTRLKYHRQMRSMILGGGSWLEELPRWLRDKESTSNAGDSGCNPGLGRSPGEERGYPVWHSCLGNPMDRGACWATVHGFIRVRHDLATKQ